MRKETTRYKRVKAEEQIMVEYHCPKCNDEAIECNYCDNEEPDEIYCSGDWSSHICVKCYKKGLHKKGKK